MGLGPACMIIYYRNVPRGMRCDARFLTIIAVSFIAVVFLAADASEGADGAELPGLDDVFETDIVVYGYISNTSNVSGNIPLEGVDVTLYDSGHATIASTETKEDGRFSFDCEKNTLYYITFEREGYSVRSTGTHVQSSDGMYSFSVGLMEPPDENGEYPITGSATSTSAIGMGITKGSVFGNIMGVRAGEDPFPLNEATVTITSANGQVYTGTTDSDGYFEIREVDYGEYSLKASCNGFMDSEPITVSTSTDGISVVLEERDLSFGFFGNLDAPHSLLLVGMIVLVIVLLASFVAFKRAQRPDSEISIVATLDEPADQHHEDDIRHP